MHMDRSEGALELEPHQSLFSVCFTSQRAKERKPSDRHKRRKESDSAAETGDSDTTECWYAKLNSLIFIYLIIDKKARLK